MKDYPGVQQTGVAKFQVQFRVKNKGVCGGTYSTPQEAHEVYLQMTAERNKEYITPVNIIEGEIWKEIAGYHGRYWVSNFGRVKNTNHMHTGLESLMALQQNRLGYIVVHLRPKLLKVSILVWVAFNGDYDRKKTQVNHKDLDKSNNRLDNFEVISVRENQSHSVQKIKGKTNVGCYYDKNKRKWIALIWYEGKQHYIGGFETEDLAHWAYLNEVKRIGETNKYSYAS